MIGSVQERQEFPSVAAVTDALGRVLNHQANALDLVSPTPGRVLFGVAVTIRFLPHSWASALPSSASHANAKTEL
ncbi:hypothetical protein [Mesorhizobium hawassense]|uniref:hypothetical protein n=1 Tax=Mesorhizobium hawassense TaxID=1209954 RepID=UPI0011BD9B50|nr:hypothetical protein [Mesorhizobium hawassense]